MGVLARMESVRSRALCLRPGLTVGGLMGGIKLVACGGGAYL